MTTELPTETPELLTDLLETAAALRDLEDRQRALVGRLRTEGASWSTIGGALGVSKQAAAKRFGDVKVGRPLVDALQGDLFDAPAPAREVYRGTLVKCPARLHRIVPGHPCDECAADAEPDPAGTVVVIPCGVKKLDHDAPAGQLYTGNLHRSARIAADAMVARGEASRVLILSARYGLLELDEVIEPYDLTMGEPGSVTPAVVANQLRRSTWIRRVVALTPSRYTAALAAAVEDTTVALEAPLAGSRGMLDQRKKLATIARG